LIPRNTSAFARAELSVPATRREAILACPLDVSHGSPAPSLALASFIVDVGKGGDGMGRVDDKVGDRTRDRSGSTLRLLYESARREVFADPAAAVRKYQPDWEFSLPVAAAASPRTPVRPPAKPDHR